MERSVVHVCRHGEVFNPQGVLYGRLPGYHLSDVGRQMAQGLADFFVEQGCDITHVVASPLERAVETATPTAQAFGLQVCTDSDLIEAANTFEGQAVHANRAALFHPRVWARYRNPLRPSWGEPYAVQAKRMSVAVSRALRAGFGHEVMVVSHQLPIWCLRSFVEGRPFAHVPSQRQCSLSSVTSLVFEGFTLRDVIYREPNAALLHSASDMTPGSSAAAVNKGR